MVEIFGEGSSKLAWMQGMTSVIFRTDRFRYYLAVVDARIRQGRVNPQGRVFVKHDCAIESHQRGVTFRKRINETIVIWCRRF